MKLTLNYSLDRSNRVIESCKNECQLKIALKYIERLTIGVYRDQGWNCSMDLYHYVQEKVIKKRLTFTSE